VTLRLHQSSIAPSSGFTVGALALGTFGRWVVVDPRCAASSSFDTWSFRGRGLRAQFVAGPWHAYGLWADPTTERASFSPTIAKTFSTRPLYPPLPQVLSYQYSSPLSIQKLSDDLPEPAKMGRKFFVGGNFKMCVDTLPRVQRPPALDTPGTGPTL
jgi:hypothetical protein